MTSAFAQPMTRSALFDGVPVEEMQRVHNRLHPVSFATNHTLIAQGSWPGALYIIRSGVLAIDLETDAGDRQLDRLIPGECAGEVSLLTGLPATARVSALVDTECWELRHVDFVALLTVCPTVARNVGLVLGQRLYHRSVHLHRTGILHLMRLRVRRTTPLELPEQIARSIAFHLNMPVLVLDERVHSDWRDVERAPELDAIIGSQEAWKRLLPSESAQPLASHARGISVETWARLEAWLPDSITHALLMTEVDVERVPFPDVIEREVKRDVTLWAEGDGELPSDVIDVALLSRQTHSNTRRSLEQSGREYRRNVVRGFVPEDQDSSIHLQWLARHLAGMKIGLTLGSGGARGFAHLGVLDALRRLTVPIDYVGGCSIGACVGAGLASGLSNDQILHTIADSAHAAFRPVVPFHSLTSNAGFVKVVRDLWGDREIEDTPTPLAVVATDILQGIEVVLDRGCIWKAVMASATIPGIYPPVWVGEHCLVDGGVVDPMPVTVTRGLGADVVIAVKLSGAVWREPAHGQASDEDAAGESPNILDIMHHSFDLMSTDLYTRAATHGDVTVVVDVPSLPVREFIKGIAYVPEGDRALMKVLPELRLLLPWIPESAPVLT